SPLPSCSSMLSPHPCSPLFPYTTLFRSATAITTGTKTPEIQRLADRISGVFVPDHPRHLGELGVAAHARGPHQQAAARVHGRTGDRKSTRLNSSHVSISYAVFCLNKKMS